MHHVCYLPASKSLKIHEKITVSTYEISTVLNFACSSLLSRVEFPPERPKKTANLSYLSFRKIAYCYENFKTGGGKGDGYCLFCFTVAASSRVCAFFGW